MPSATPRRSVLVNTIIPWASVKPSKSAIDGLHVPALDVLVGAKDVFECFAEGEPVNGVDIERAACDAVYDEAVEGGRTDWEALQAVYELKEAASIVRRFLGLAGFRKPLLYVNEGIVDVVALYILTAVAAKGAPMLEYALRSVRAKLGPDDAIVKEYEKAVLHVRTLVDVRVPQPLPPPRMISHYDSFDFDLLWDAAIAQDGHNPRRSTLFAIPLRAEAPAQPMDTRALYLDYCEILQVDSSGLFSAPLMSVSSRLWTHIPISDTLCPSLHLTVEALRAECKRLFLANDGSDRERVLVAATFMRRLALHRALGSSRCTQLVRPGRRTVILHQLAPTIFAWVRSKATLPLAAAAADSIPSQALCLYDWAWSHRDYLDLWLDEDLSGPTIPLLHSVRRDNDGAALFVNGNFLERKQQPASARVLYERGGALEDVSCRRRIAEARCRGELGYARDRSVGLAALQSLQDASNPTYPEVPRVLAEHLEEAERANENITRFIPVGSCLLVETHRQLRKSARLGDVAAVLALALRGSDHDQVLLRHWHDFEHAEEDEDPPSDRDDS